ncbi:hypothetical protein CTAYLR_002806 [Chrysophaeum taylorii]|uniref:Tyrosinase copper-binding domain-containing protein n=1 Tax=Chrysophaeum taylorii TaxID=2483200 RepID=A0AAD7XHW0_9STRA|nr:hypothetical protein CTAYLR_002806 [Chrysophaeum taylorii]
MKRRSLRVASCCREFFSRRKPSSGGRPLESRTSGIAKTRRVFGVESEYERSLGRAIGDGLFEGIILEVYQEETSLLVTGATRCDADVVETRVGIFELRAKTRSTVTSFELVGKYVRREIRARIYGEKYRSADWFTATHAYYSAARDCDHWHAGDGVVTTHMAVTLKLEQSLQAVDPSTRVPYRDVTIECATRKCCWAKSVLWSPHWFSTVTPNNTEHVVDSGVTNADSMLMVPWNTNPTPFLTRAQTIYDLPNYVNIPCFGCDAIRGGAFQKKRLFGSVVPLLSGRLHAWVHGMIGGVWNYFPELKATEDGFNRLLRNVPSASNAISKRLRRSGIVVECPEYCAKDALALKCQCGLAATRIRRKRYRGLSSWDIINASAALTEYTAMLGSAFDDGRHDSTHWDVVLRQLANLGHIGNVVTDASPADPIFWIIHGILERFLHQANTISTTPGPTTASNPKTQ